MRRYLAALLLITALVSTLFASSALASDAPGCDGLQAYSDAMLDAHQDYLDSLDEAGFDLDDAFIMTEDDWQAFADAGGVWHAAILAIQPPDWITDWHAATAEGVALLEEIGTEAIERTIFVVIEYEDQIDANAEESDRAATEASSVCSDFDTFLYDWDAIDGEIDGTPVADESPSAYEEST